MAVPSPDELSPVRCEPRPVGLPYELTWADLAPCLPDHDGVPGTAYVAHTKQGLHGGDSSQILTLRFRDRDGHEQETVCFIKLDGAPRHGEAPRYRYLAEHGVPVASLRTSVERDGATVLVLELLPVIGTTADEADDLLSLVATLNAVPDPPHRLFTPQPGMPQPEFDALVEQTLPSRRRRELITAYRAAAERSQRMPKALNHGELYFQQLGWSAADRGHRLVLFDLATMALLPRFTDVAGILDGLVAQTGRSDRELFDVYLRNLRAATADTSSTRTTLGPPPQRLWEELLTTRLVRNFESLPWLTEPARDDLPETAGEMITRIERDVSLLG